MAESPYLTGQLLLAMPAMNDPRFHKSVIFLCLHDAAGAMGLVLNNPIPGLQFAPLMEQLDILPEHAIPHVLRAEPVYSGGPVEQTRGFLLHDHSWSCPDTIRIGPDFCVTGTTDGLRELAGTATPPRARFILGYAGWGAGQLERELQDNAWLSVPPANDTVFAMDTARQWDTAFAAFGIDPATLSADAGHA